MRVLVLLTLLMALTSACFTVSTSNLSIARGEVSYFTVNLSNDCGQPAMVWLYSSELGFDKRVIVSAGESEEVKIQAPTNLAGEKTYALDVYINGNKETHYLKAAVRSINSSVDYTIVAPLSLSTSSDTITIPITLKTRSKDDLTIILFKNVDGENKFWKIVDLPANSSKTIQYTISGLSDGCRDLYFSAVYGNENITRKVTVCVGSNYNVGVDLSTGMDNVDGEESLILDARVTNLDSNASHRVFLTVEDAPVDVKIFSPDETVLAPGEDAVVRVVVKPFNFNTNISLSVYVDGKLQQRIPIDSTEIKTRLSTGFLFLSTSEWASVIVIFLIAFAVIVKKNERVRSKLVSTWNKIKDSVNHLRNNLRR